MYMEFYKLNHEVNKKDLERFSYPNQKLGVIIHVENEKGEILLQQRGPNSRDENGMFEDIGGKIEESDITFKDAIKRELIEEIGDKAQIEISRSIGIFHIPKKDVYWVMVIYFGLYKGGDIKVMEPEKCLGYKWFSLEQALFSPKVTNSCKFLIQNICQLEEIKRD